MIGAFLDWLVWNPRTHYPWPGVGDPWIKRRKLGRMARPLCEIIGHDPQGDPQPVWSTCGPFMVPPGDPRTAGYGHGFIQPYTGIVYFMRECSRCKKRIPVDDQNSIHKEAKLRQTEAVMNASRNSYGLAPISWDD